MKQEHAFFTNKTKEMKANLTQTVSKIMRIGFKSLTYCF